MEIAIEAQRSKDQGWLARLGVGTEMMRAILGVGRVRTTTVRTSECDAKARCCMHRVRVLCIQYHAVCKKHIISDRSNNTGSEPISKYGRTDLTRSCIFMQPAAPVAHNARGESQG